MKPVALSIFAIVLFSCTSSHKTMKASTFDTEGHRGCRGLMPENTIRAMLHAIDLDVTTLEMDVHITKDLQVVVSHDAWFNPDITTKPDGSFIAPNDHSYILYNMNYDSISKYDVGSKPYDKFPQQKKLHVSKPLLSVLIDSVEAYLKVTHKTVLYNIEIKSAPDDDNIYHPEPAKFTELLMAVINQKQIQQRVIIQSFDFRSLQYLHAKYPAINTSALIEADDKRSVDKVINDLGFTPTIYSPAYALVTENLIQDCHKKGIHVIPWTVNDLTEMKRLKSLGVDGLISDYPNLYKNL